MAATNRNARAVACKTFNSHRHLDAGRLAGKNRGRASRTTTAAAATCVGTAVAAAAAAAAAAAGAAGAHAQSTSITVADQERMAETQVRLLDRIGSTRSLEEAERPGSPHAQVPHQQEEEKRLDLSKPRWDQSTFEGRAKHFFVSTNPLNVFASGDVLHTAKSLVHAYHAGMEPASTTADEVWRAKQLYDSAFHPDTGEKVFLPGRMSFQVPGNMLISGCMMTFYRSTPAVIFWQWINQSFNAIVNYSNRNASAPITKEQLGMAYLGATGASVATAVTLNKVIASSPTLSTGIIGRFVPLVAVASANCINIPMMRQQEIKGGIVVSTPDGRELGASQQAAKEGVTQVVVSRIGMAAPTLMIPPLIMSRVERTAMLVRNPWLKAPLTVGLAGLMLCFSTPLCCAAFPQMASIPVSRLEPALQQKARAMYPGVESFVYNKGL